MKIIINADDYGITEHVNDAIEELVKLGVVTSTTVMVNKPYAYQIKKILNNPIFGAGLHFNLTDGIPLSKPNDIYTLIDKKGCFYHVKKFEHHIKIGKIKKEHILIELNEQYNWLYNLIGDKLTHIDSHQNINKYKIIRDVLIQYSKRIKNKIGLRWYNKTYIIKNNEKIKYIDPSILNVNEFSIKRVLKETYFRYQNKSLRKYYNIPDSMLYVKSNNTRDLLKTLMSLNIFTLPKKTYEIMCHPAKSIDGLTKSRMLKSRIEEYELLKSVAFQKFVQNVQVINYKTLKN